MNGRKGIALVLVCCFGITCLGCATDSATKKRLPKAETEILFAHFKEREAGAPKHSPIQRENMLEQARSAYERALKLNPNSEEAEEAALGIARIYAALGNHTRAVEEFRKTYKKHATSRVAFEVGMYHNRRKEYDAAATRFKKALELAKSEKQKRLCRKNLGFTLARAGRSQEAFKELAYTYGEGKAHLFIARMSMILKRPDDAQRHMRLAFQKDSTLSDRPESKQLLAQLQQSAPAQRPIMHAGHQNPNGTTTGYHGHLTPPQPPSGHLQPVAGR